MHKILRNTFKAGIYLLLIFVLVVGGTIGYMYFSADMCIPQITEPVPNYELIKEGDYRQWGENNTNQCSRRIHT